MAWSRSRLDAVASFEDSRRDERPAAEIGAHRNAPNAHPIEVVERSSGRELDAESLVIEVTAEQVRSDAEAGSEIAVLRTVHAHVDAIAVVRKSAEFEGAIVDHRDQATDLAFTGVDAEIGVPANAGI